jgi:hypothetical protein
LQKGFKHFSHMDMEVWHYHTSWKEGKVNLMWLEKVGRNLYVAIAYNPEKNVSMPMSKPRPYAEAMQWAQGWCGTWCPLPA